MDIKDLAGLSDPLKKLFEVVDGWVGRATKAYFTKKDADATAYTILRISQAVDDARKSGMYVEYRNNEIGQISPLLSEKSELLLLAERAASREQHRQLIEQQNIEQITAQAAEELRDVETVSDEPVDSDWIARFFDNARHISNEEMQMLWGRILAGEVKRPNTYSLRTLELLRNLSKNEAEIFVKVAKLSIKYKTNTFIIYPSEGKPLNENFGIYFGHLVLLKEIGLLAPVDNIGIKIPQTEVQITEVFEYGDTAIVLDRPQGHAGFTFSTQAFTKAGVELLSLIRIEPHTRYVQMIGNVLRKPDCIVKYGTISGREGSILHISDVEELV